MTSSNVEKPCGFSASPHLNVKGGEMVVYPALHALQTKKKYPGLMVPVRRPMKWWKNFRRWMRRIIRASRKIESVTQDVKETLENAKDDLDGAVDYLTGGVDQLRGKG